MMSLVELEGEPLTHAGKRPATGHLSLQTLDTANRHINR